MPAILPDPAIEEVPFTRASLGVVFGALDTVLEGAGERSSFRVRRARRELRSSGSGPVARAVRRLVAGLEAGSSQQEVAALLAPLACALEERGQLADADAALARATRLDPHRSDLLLHAARVARKAGSPLRAARLYGRVRERADGAPIAAMARVGEALVSDDPLVDLGRAMRHARERGCAEAAAVAQVERGRLRRRVGDLRGAIRDLLAAHSRFTGLADRARILQELADLLFAAGDRDGTRRVLEAIVRRGGETARDQARAGLHALARERGDEVGARRWAGTRPDAGLAGLTPLSECAADARLLSRRAAGLLGA